MLLFALAKDLKIAPSKRGAPVAQNTHLTEQCRLKDCVDREVLIRARVIETPLFAALWKVHAASRRESQKCRLAELFACAIYLARVTLIDSASLIKSKCGIRRSGRIAAICIGQFIFSQSAWLHGARCYLLSPARINRWRLWPKESARTASTWEPSALLDGGGGAIGSRRKTHKQLSWLAADASIVRVFQTANKLSTQRIWSLHWFVSSLKKAVRLNMSCSDAQLAQRKKAHLCWEYFTNALRNVRMKVF